MMTNVNCPIWGSGYFADRQENVPDSGMVRYDSWRAGGKFLINKSHEDEIKRQLSALKPIKKAALSQKIYQNNKYNNNTAEINEEFINRIQIPTTTQKINSFKRYIISLCSDISCRFYIRCFDGGVNQNYEEP